MRNKPNTLLAGVAALALIAGAGVALAQQGPQNPTDQSGGTGMKPQSQMQAKPSTGAQQKTQTEGKTGQSAQDNSAANSNGNASAKANSQPQQRSAQELKGNAQQSKGNNSAEASTPSKKPNKSAQHIKRDRSTAQQERNGSLQGLQGNAAIPMQGAGANVQLSDQQRSTIRKTVIDSRSAPRIGQVDFAVQPGTVIPRGGIHIAPLPRTLARIEPEWRGYRYFVYEGELVIVNPRDMRIVAVVTV